MSDPAIIQLETRVDRLWQRYVALRGIAQQSNDIADGIAAGRAFGALMAEFVDRDARVERDNWRSLGDVVQCLPALQQRTRP